MSNRHSQLDSISKLRSANRDAQRLRLADALRAEAELEGQRAAIESETATIARSQRTALADPGLNVNALLDLERYELVLRAQATAVQRQLEAVQTETERRRQQLAEAEQQVRAIEKLADKRAAQHSKTQNRKQQHQLDEVAVTRFLNNKMS